MDAQKDLSTYINPVQATVDHLSHLRTQLRTLPTQDHIEPYLLTLTHQDLQLLTVAYNLTHLLTWWEQVRKGALVAQVARHLRQRHLYGTL